MKGSNLTAEEKERAKSYFDGLFSDSASLPLSFRYSGKLYRGFPENEFDVTVNDGEITAVHRDGTVFSLYIRRNYEYGQCEWYMTAENRGESDSGVISEAHSADICFTGATPKLNYILGDRNRDPFCFWRVDTEMRPGTRLTLFPVQGKSTGHQRPYYRLSFGDTTAVIAVGWHGRWKTDFFADNEDNTVRFRASQYNFSSYLKPGEKAVFPTVCIILCDNCDYHAMNAWRRYYYDNVFYRYKGNYFGPKKIAGAYLSNSVSINEGTFHELIDAYNEKLEGGFDLFWVDAGWYCKKADESLDDVTSYWRTTGTWRMDKNRFPTSMKGVTERLKKERGADMLLWFEPERVTVGTDLYDRNDATIAWDGNTEFKLLDMRKAEVRKELIETVDGIMTESGAELYRQDFNFNPYPYWIAEDRRQGADRDGMTENAYITGMMSYYDEIHKRYPKYPIDMCASGGMRNDYSVMDKSVMLTFTDFDWNDTVQMQNMRLGMFEWFSNFAGGSGQTSTYTIQSNFAPYFAVSPGRAYVLDPEKPYDNINRQFRIWEQIKGLYDCDYYPLTEMSHSSDVWVAWEFYDTEEKAGFAQFFRRGTSSENRGTFRLYGLESEKKYLLRELNNGEEKICTGDELMNRGIGVTVEDKPGCSLWKITEME